jgi:hypothetical protein
MLLKSHLLLFTYELFEPDRTAVAFARELHLFDFALARRTSKQSFLPGQVFLSLWVAA